MADPTFTNLSFDIAGPAPGLAAGWMLRLQSSAEEIAGYAPAPERPQEDFERGWRGNESFLFAFASAGVEPALFGSVLSAEGFEQGWSQNESFLTELASVEAAKYAPGAKSVEDFEAQWAGNESFITAFTPANLALGPSDGFESGWHSNQSFLFAFGNANLSLGPSETFESGWTTHMATV